MGPGYTSTNSGSTRRKRNTVETGFLRTDEQRAAKRSRAPSHADDYARPTTQALHFNRMSPPPPHHQTQQPHAHKTYVTQTQLQPSTQQPKTDTSGLGRSILDRGPFQEESDSDEESEVIIRGEREEDNSTSLFVNSDESDQSSQRRYTNHDEEDITDRYQEGIQTQVDDSYTFQQQAPISRHQHEDIDSRYSNTASPTPQYLPATRRQPQEPQRQDQPASTQNSHVRSNLENISGRQVPTSRRQPLQHGQANGPCIPSRETARIDQNQRRELPPKHIPKHDNQAQAQAQAREQNRARVPVQRQEDAHHSTLRRARSPQHYPEATRSSLEEVARERAILSQATPSREQSQAQTTGHTNSLPLHHVQTSQHHREDMQSTLSEEARERVIPSYAHLPREQSRAHINARNHADYTDVTEQMQDGSHLLQRQEQRALDSDSKHETHHSLTSTSAPSPNTGKPKPPGEFKRVKNLLHAIRPPRSHDQKSRRPQFQQDIEYPSEAESFSPPAPLPLPRQSQEPSPTTSNSAEALTPKLLERYSTQELLDFKPNSTDSRVRGWLHGPKRMNWDDVTTLLDLYEPGYILESVKARQRIYAAKLAMRPEREQAVEQQVWMQPISHEAARSYEESYEKEANNTFQPRQPVTTLPVKAPDAARLADRLEKERLDRQIREDQVQRREEELLQRIRTLEEELLANVIKLQEQETEQKLKAEVEGKYHKLKEEARTHKERLKDELTARTKAERELKQAQTEANRLRLAKAASARKEVRVEGGGFAFPKDDSDVDKTPLKRKSQKAKEHDGIELRADGHPRTAGKSLPPASIQALYKHVTNAIEEEERVPAPPEVIQEPDLTYFVYTVHRKQWSRDRAEPSDDEAIICGQYSYLNQANAEVTYEILRPHGNNGIAIDPLQDRTLHQGVTDFNMAWAQLDVPTGHVKAWVQRQLHTEFTGQLPVFEARGLLARTIFAVRQETTTTTTSTNTNTNTNTTADSASIAASTSTTEDAEIYTTFDLANLKASEKLFRLEHGGGGGGCGGEQQSRRYDDVQRRQRADVARKQALEDLEDGGELFDGEWSKQDAGGVQKIRIWVVKKTVVGPRN